MEKSHFLQVNQRTINAHVQEPWNKLPKVYPLFRHTQIGELVLKKKTVDGRNPAPPKASLKPYKSWYGLPPTNW